MTNFVGETFFAKKVIPHTLSKKTEISELMRKNEIFKENQSYIIYQYIFLTFSDFDLF